MNNFSHVLVSKKKKKVIGLTRFDSNNSCLIDLIFLVAYITSTVLKFELDWSIQPGTEIHSG